MKAFTTLVGLAAVIGLASGHMEMTNPAPLRSKKNSHTTNVDYDMVNPLAADGSNFPCKGYLGLLGTSAGQSVATWEAGSSQSFTIEGGAYHNGGSCQASLSLDGGKSFTVIKSFLGGCPGAGATSWDFVVPADVPATNNALFAWTWFNQIGNREMYMNCAVVNIAAGKSAQRPAVPFTSRPGIFVANVNKGCGTLEGSDVQFPDPGPDVSTRGSNFKAPVGNCPASVSYPGNSGSDTPAQSAPQVPNTTPTAQPTTTTLPGGIFIPVDTTTATPPAPVVETTTQAAQNPIATPQTPSPPVTGGQEIGPQPEWSRCDQEGVFNCVGGTRFQRCGSGLWHPFTQTAPGTLCKSGVSYDYTVIVIKKKKRVVRFRQARRTVEVV